MVLTPKTTNSLFVATQILGSSSLTGQDSQRRREAKGIIADYVMIRNSTLWEHSRG